MATHVVSKYTGYTDANVKVQGAAADYAVSPTSVSSNAQNTSSRSGTVTIQQENSNLSGTINWTQAADSYEDTVIVTSITLTLGTPSVIPASGGSVSTTSYSVVANGYIRHDWNSGTYSTGSTTSWTVTNSASVSWGSAVSAASKGTTTTGITTAGTLYCTASFSGKSDSKSVYVTQQANSAGAPTYTAFTISTDAEPNYIPASGGSINSLPLSDISATGSGYVTYTSNATAVSTTYPTSFTMAWTGVTANSKGTTPSNVTPAGTLYGKGTWNGLTSNTISVQIYQEANVAGSPTYTALTYSLGTPAVIPASGGSVNSTTIEDAVLLGYAVYTSKQTGGTSLEVTIPSANISWTGVTVGSKGITPSQETDAGTLYCHATYSGFSHDEHITVLQQANTKSSTPTWTGLVITLSSVSDIPASGGTISSTSYTAKRSGYYLYTSNGKEPTTGNTSYSINASWTPVSAISLEAEVTGRTYQGDLVLNATERTVNLSGSGSTPVYQQANELIGTTTTTSGYSQFVSSSVTAYGYTVSSTTSSINATSAATAVTITVTAEHTSETAITWDLYRATGTTSWYTSKYTGTTWGSPQKYDTQTETDSDIITDTPTITNNNNWITATTTQIKIAAQSAGAAARSGTVTYWNSTASKSISVSQAAGASVFWIYIDGETDSEQYIGYTEEILLEITCGGNTSNWWTVSVSGNGGNYITITPQSGTSGDLMSITCNTTLSKDITITLGCGTARATLIVHTNQ